MDFRSRPGCFLISVNYFPFKEQGHGLKDELLSLRSVTKLLIVLLVFVAQNGMGQGGDSEPLNTSRAAATASAPSNGFQQRDPRYTMRPGDILALTFTLTPEFNQSVTVQPDGYVTLRGAGDVLIKGQALPQVSETIRKAYAKIMRDPIIFVTPTKFESPSIVVGGQVDKPGKYEWTGEITLTQAIALAGGFKDSAKHSQVLLFRRVSNDWAETKIVNVKDMLKRNDLHEDPILRPGDMLFVPKNAVSKIRPYLPIPSLGMNMTQF